MTNAEYRRMTDAELRGRKVRTLRSMSNANTTIPVGAVLTIEKKFAGFSLVAEECPHCHVRVHITKVEPSAVELLPESGA